MIGCVFVCLYLASVECADLALGACFSLVPGVRVPEGHIADFIEGLGPGEFSPIGWIGLNGLQSRLAFARKLSSNMNC